jgi:hypothetical protein
LAVVLLVNLVVQLGLAVAVALGIKIIMLLRPEHPIQYKLAHQTEIIHSLYPRVL